jgi:hypothetical protein
MCSRGMSSEMRPSVRRLSSGALRWSGRPGERWRGVGDADDLLALSMFSNCARRDDTGLMDEPSMLSSCWDSIMSTSWSAGTGRRPVAAHGPLRRSAHGRGVVWRGTRNAKAEGEVSV